jgi:hypothetical protein
MSSTLLNPYIMAAAGCQEDTNSGTQGGSGGSGWGLAGTNFPLGLGMKIDAGHALVGQTLNSVTFWLSLGGTSGSVNMAAYHWAGSNHTYGSERAKSNTLSSSSVGIAFADYKWTFATPATVVAGDYISVDIPSSTGSSTNYLSEGSAYQTNTIAQEYRGGWTQKGFGIRFTAEYNCP